MSEQDELLSDAFHLLAQPIVALRARVELGLLRPLSENESHDVLASCLALVDQLMGELALVRELATLEEEAPVERCNGLALVEEIAAELAPVADDRAISLELEAEPASLLASEAGLRRALFVLLDATLGTARRGSRITLALRRKGDGYELKLLPGVPPGGRRELCRKLLRRAGGGELALGDDGTVAEFCAAGEAALDGAGGAPVNGSSSAASRPHAGRTDAESGS